MCISVFSLDKFVAYSCAATAGFEIQKIHMFLSDWGVRLVEGGDGVVWFDCNHT